MTRRRDDKQLLRFAREAVREVRYEQLQLIAFELPEMACVQGSSEADPKKQADMCGVVLSQLGSK